MATTNPTGLAMLAEVADHKVYRDLAGHSLYRTWTNRVTAEIAELVTAGWLRVDPWSKQWKVTDAGQAALAANGGDQR